MRLPRKPLRTLAVLALAAFSLTGCMKLDMNMTVNSDDTVDGTIIMALDKSVLQLSGKSPEQAFEEAGDSLTELPKGTRTEVYDDGKYYGKKIVYDDLPLTEFNTGEKGAPSITHANGKYLFTADLDTGADGLGPQAEMVKPFLSSLQITFAITFPGKVVEHDAKAVVDGDTVRWNVALGGKNELRAVAEEGSAFPWLVVAVVGGVLGLAVIAAIVFLAVWLTRRKAPAATADPNAVASFDPATVAQPVGGHPTTQPYATPPQGGADGHPQP
ncbi:LppM family (lipo)protein [Catellatospora sichuanensis]|uniref:LppM family (lipo)protein n=1 Tax=Catellatospora sichuanensis TaxID=1969805 RepID=UPI0011837264|nr:hypothetical protein [Catellatospora sichuanensis]